MLSGWFVDASRLRLRGLGGGSSLLGSTLVAALGLRRGAPEGSLRHLYGFDSPPLGLRWRGPEAPARVPEGFGSPPPAGRCGCLGGALDHPRGPRYPPWGSPSPPLEPPFGCLNGSKTIIFEKIDPKRGASGPDQGVGGVGVGVGSSSGSPATPGKRSFRSS